MADATPTLRLSVLFRIGKVLRWVAASAISGGKPLASLPTIKTRRSDWIVLGRSISGIAVSSKSVAMDAMPAFFRWFVESIEAMSKHRCHADSDDAASHR